MSTKTMKGRTRRLLLPTLPTNYKDKTRKRRKKKERRSEGERRRKRREEGEGGRRREKEGEGGRRREKEGEGEEESGEKEPWIKQPTSNKFPSPITNSPSLKANS